MFVPLERLVFASITEAKPNHLLLCPGTEPGLFWIAENGGDTFAVFLNGPHARHGFPTARGSNWKGLLVGPLELRVDVSSAHLGFRETAGDLTASDGRLTMNVATKEGGFPAIGRLLVGSIEMPSKTERIYFSRWGLGVLEQDEWCELVKFDGNSISSTLIRAQAAAAQADARP